MGARHPAVVVQQALLRADPGPAEWEKPVAAEKAGSAGRELLPHTRERTESPYIHARLLRRKRCSCHFLSLVEANDTRLARSTDIEEKDCGSGDHSPRTRASR